MRNRPVKLTRGEMMHDVVRRQLDAREIFGTAHIALDMLDSRQRSASGIEHHDLLAARQQRGHEFAADEAGATRYDVAARHAVLAITNTPQQISAMPAQRIGPTASPRKNMPINAAIT